MKLKFESYEYIPLSLLDQFLDSNGRYTGEDLQAFGFLYAPGELVPLNVRYSAALEYQWALKSKAMSLHRDVHEEFTRMEKKFLEEFTGMFANLDIPQIKKDFEAARKKAISKDPVLAKQGEDEIKAIEIKLAPYFKAMNAGEHPSAHMSTYNL